jgi:PhnB protein
MQAIPHLHFKGTCSEAFGFYAKTLGGHIAFSMTYGESPAAAQTPREARDQIIHARLELGSQAMAITGCDALEDRYQRPQGFSVLAEIAEPAEAERVFGALAERGTITMPFQETFWAKGFGMCTDRFGIPWMVNCVKPMEQISRTPEAGHGRSARG